MARTQGSIRGQEVCRMRVQVRRILGPAVEVARRQVGEIECVLRRSVPLKHSTERSPQTFDGALRSRPVESLINTSKENVTHTHRI
jgi:hypothetical protein